MTQPIPKGWQIQPHYGDGGDRCGYVYCKWALLFWNGAKYPQTFATGDAARAFMKLHPNGPPHIAAVI